MIPQSTGGKNKTKTNKGLYYVLNMLRTESAGYLRYRFPYIPLINFTSRRALSMIMYLRGYCTPGPYFLRLCAFSQKIKQLRTKYPMDLVRNVPRNSNITILLQ